MAPTPHTIEASNVTMLSGTGWVFSETVPAGEVWYVVGGEADHVSGTTSTGNSCDAAVRTDWHEIASGQVLAVNNGSVNTETYAPVGAYAHAGQTVGVYDSDTDDGTSIEFNGKVYVRKIIL